MTDKLKTVKPLAMISQPMRGLTDSEIDSVRVKARAVLEGLGYEVLDTRFKDFQGEASGGLVKHVPVRFLARAIDAMSRCDAVLFCPGWWTARGCTVERRVAKEYGLDIIDSEGRVWHRDDAGQWHRKGDK